MKTLELDLFSEPTTETQSCQDTVEVIRGLRYLPNFVTEEEEGKLLHLLDENLWSCELSRRVQHYGYKYDYKSRRIDESMHIGELPKWLRHLGKRLVEYGVFDTIPDQVIVNEYLPGQGISAHIDCQPCFGDTIASLSLLSTCVMDFTEAKTEENIPVFLEPRSVVVLKEDARYLWKHSIAKRKQDVYNGQNHARSRRISLTFRSVKWE